MTDCTEQKNELTLLIVDDSKSYRHLLSNILSQWGYHVLQAQDGLHALTILNENNINVVISDWEMPEIDGGELCRQVRQHDYGHYIYIILVTARQATDDLVLGLESGADDFLSKPIHQSQLRARLHVAERILMLENKLEVRNQRLSTAYQQIEQDLQAAARLQRSVLPATTLNSEGYQADWIFLPSAYVSGDLLNYFMLDKHHIAFYSIDVAGHGVSAAMLSLAVSREFLSGRINERLLIVEGQIVPPHEVVAALNQRFCLDNEDITSYFTLIYGLIDTRTGKGSLCQAGHPTPFIIRQHGELVSVGGGGIPVGLFQDSEYQCCDFSLESGDRLYLYSDGISECENQDGELYGEARLQKMMIDLRDKDKDELFQIVEDTLIHWCQPNVQARTEFSRFFNDDISLVAIERIA
ncbi:SpoIIE family protein phosphatase [Hafnia paralvei]|uniref:PP2C family protein-serine/threonine phosphatase n=1 Tax=Hafnia paralvei TaxID=546367 RepID=UPI001CCF55C6|nr:SpoIIE family protein phosphatase [Hafnia paralvei]MCE9908848.1 SpoIIE family protein phosphatase [Hafnia paralvei]MCE9912682.1 SpoIIE family protein phosphatase [Hafnia paralvei]MCK2179960.1 SpoIIE family protein phosphatase [Hafnia paralvei]UBM42647.1 SpoIIE family protein phosphatase [Hafnia paralvei]